MTLEVKTGRWVFGYGSLMWRPGFPYVERATATLHGRRRAFCIYSVHHRGTPERPGLVLGLAPGGSVRGVAYGVAEPHGRRSTPICSSASSRPRPISRRASRCAWPDGRRVNAVTFLSDRSHPQWAGVLAPERQAELIAGARGLSGRNIDYLRDLVDHLRAEGLRDPAMERLLDRVTRLEAEAA